MGNSKIAKQVDLIKSNVIGSIIINNGRAENYRQFKSNSNWFKNAEYYSIKEDGNCLIITKHYLEVPKNAQKTKTGHFMCLSGLPLGKFKFDEQESTEDELVIYCH
jgi:hypothetical protein